MANKIPGRLTGAACYLAGPMTAVADFGATWRQDLSKDLKQMGIVVLDPCDKAIEIGTEDAEARANLHDNHKAGNFTAVQRQMKVIRRVDLRCVDLSSFIICRLDGSHTTGTFEELAMATMEQKPVLLWLDGELNLRTCNPWLFAQVDPEFIFESKAALLDYLFSLHTSVGHPGHRKWMLFDFASLYKEALEGFDTDDGHSNTGKFYG